VLNLRQNGAARAVAIEAVKDQQTLSELAAKYELHPNQIAEWKRLFQSSASLIFASETSKKSDKEAEDIATLYEQIGRLQVENAFLKKKLL